MSAKQTPDINDFPGMVAVSEIAFFSVVGKLDVHPSVSSSARYNQIFGYVSTWTLRNGDIVGKSTGGTALSSHLYMVTERFYSSNKTAFEGLIAASTDSSPFGNQINIEHG